MGSIHPFQALIKSTQVQLRRVRMDAVKEYYQFL